MNPETKQFEPETPETPPEWTRFRRGETVMVKGIEMRIEKVTRLTLTLRPLGQVAPPPPKLSRGLRRHQEREQERQEAAREKQREREAAALDREMAEMEAETVRIVGDEEEAES